jgi:microcystin-dependent protein
MNPSLGEIKLVPYNFAPTGWAPCNGALLKISQNTPLFSLLGNQFGGDGRTTFALPSMAGVSTQGSGRAQYIIALAGVFPSRN